MKLLVIILLTLIVTVSLAVVAIENPGYVLVAAGPWTLETTLALTGIALILGFASIYYAIRFVIRVLGVPGGLRNWRQRSREDKSMRSLTRGLIDLAEGRWQRAEKQLLKYVHDGHAPLLNYLAAARAAQAQGADQRRDRYLKQAHESVSGADIAVGLTQAELQIQHHQLEQALATLRHLQQIAPKHPQVLKALSKLYEETGDWDQLLELIPSLGKGKVFSSEEMEVLHKKVYLALLDSTVPDKTFAGQNHSTDLAGESDQMVKLWKRIPGRFQENEEILLAYVKRRIQTGNTDQLEPLIRSVLKRHRNTALIYYYGVVNSADSRRHLAMAESLLVGQETDAVTLLTVGRLSLRNQLWGKARNYLEASLHSCPDAQAYHELGNLLDGLGEHELAAKCFRDGLRLSPGCEFSVPLKNDLKTETIAVAPRGLTHHDVTEDHLLTVDDLVSDDVDDNEKADLKKVLT